jgi:hypothetical protein
MWQKTAFKVGMLALDYGLKKRKKKKYQAKKKRKTSKKRG